MRINAAEKELEDFIAHVKKQPNQADVMSKEDQIKATELLNKIKGLIKLM